MTQSIIGATIVIVSVSSLLNTSSMASLWMMVNQIQMFFLLLLTRAYIPDDVQVAITGSKFALNPFEYIPFRRIKLYDSIIESFNSDLSNYLLNPIGIKSDSTIYNSCSILIILIIIAILHLGIFIFNKLLSGDETINNRSCFMKRLILVIKKIYMIMTFGYYIRSISELSQYLLLSSINEIYQSNVYTSLTILSFIFALLVLC